MDAVVLIGLGILAAAFARFAWRRRLQSSLREMEAREQRAREAVAANGIDQQDLNDQTLVVLREWEARHRDQQRTVRPAR